MRMLAARCQRGDRWACEQLERLKASMAPGGAIARGGARMPAGPGYENVGSAGGGGARPMAAGSYSGYGGGGPGPGRGFAGPGSMRASSDRLRTNTSDRSPYAAEDLLPMFAGRGVRSRSYRR
jgi:hypothetical protein